MYTFNLSAIDKAAKLKQKLKEKDKDKKGKGGIGAELNLGNIKDIDGAKIKAEDGDGKSV
jgi:hypothetical protein